MSRRASVSESPSVEIWDVWREKAPKISCRFNPCPNSKEISYHANEFHHSTLLQTMHGMRGFA